MSERVVLPEVSDGRISNDLRDLTEALAKAGHDISGGLLGGEYGYGAYFENDVFMMHPFCWCERGDCPWCRACECIVEQRGGDGTKTEHWVTVEECANCAGPLSPERAPNFLHKPSGTGVSWYKYIGRGMEVDLRGDWRAIFDECVASANATTEPPQAVRGGRGEGCADGDR